MEGVDLEESDGEYGEFYYVFDSKNRKFIFFEVYFEGRFVIMELDIGFVVLVVSEGVYKEYLRYVSLKDIFLKLRTYTGKLVKFMGFCYVIV